MSSLAGSQLDAQSLSSLNYCGVLPEMGVGASLDCQEAGEPALGSSLPVAGLGVGDLSSGQHFKGGIFYGMVNLENICRQLRDRKSG